MALLGVEVRDAVPIRRRGFRQSRKPARKVDRHGVAWLPVLILLGIVNLVQRGRVR